MYVSHPSYFPGQYASDGRLKWYATSSNKDLIMTAEVRREIVFCTGLANLAVYIVALLGVRRFSPGFSDALFSRARRGGLRTRILGRHWPS